MLHNYLWMFLILIVAAAVEPLTLGKCWGAAILLHPESIAMGDIGAGKLKKGMVILTYADSDRKSWSAEVNEGWLCKSGQPLTGVLEHARPLKLKISMKSSLAPAGEDNNHHDLYTVVLNLEVDNKRIIYHKKLASGNHREGVVLNVGGEIKVIELSFYVMEYPLEPVLSVSPRRLDFGILGPGQKIIKKIEITNKGRQALKWKVNQKSKDRQMDDIDALSGRYVSFMQPETQGTGQYQPGSSGKNTAEFTGHWSEADGYPEAQQNSVLKYRFSGSGIILYFWKSPIARTISLYFDNRMITQIDAYSEQTVTAEYRLNEPVGAGFHTLTMVNNLGRVVVEGIRIIGKEISRGNGKWIRIYPEIGVTTREIDYLHVSVDTARLLPGTYGYVLNVESNGGEAAIELYAEVSLEAGLKILDVYRYSFGNDVLLSTNPQGEAKASYFRDYRKQGIAFSLFSPGTPGTTEFYRWYNPHRQLHFYSYELNGGGKLSREYIFEGTIGNIATSRLPNTRELYRWQHPSTGQYFFSTDPRGEGAQKRGYKYNGIAGFVR
ncbi:MAG: hypothetical protein M0Q01_06870 [Syntrophales bacterium]|jgi:hypothetical protein|nr:hypothetical protein [Syntrophales bacterium]